MASLQDRIKTVLDECRMVILGAQVLLGVEYNAVFEPEFSRLSRIEQVTMGAGIYLVSAALALLFVPATYHLIVEDGRDTKALHELTTGVIEIALAPLAIGLGSLCFLATARVAPRTLAVLTGLAAMLVALFFWYALAWERRRAKQRRELPTLASAKHDDVVPVMELKTVTELKGKIDHVLQEARMILPGAQALLGFQFASFFTGAFTALPKPVQMGHLAALLIIALATILLLAPAAYHRIVEHGENTESFHRVAGRFLLSAIACLGLGMAAECSVIAWIVTHSGAVTVCAGLGMLITCYTLWFGYAIYRRRRPLPSRVQTS